jgi:hypothetical protein
MEHITIGGVPENKMRSLKWSAKRNFSNGKMVAAITATARFD